MLRSRSQDTRGGVSTERASGRVIRIIMWPSQCDYNDGGPNGRRPGQRRQAVWGQRSEGRGAPSGEEAGEFKFRAHTLKMRGGAAPKAFALNVVATFHKKWTKKGASEGASLRAPRLSCKGNSKLEPPLPPSLCPAPRPRRKPVPRGFKNLPKISPLSRARTGGMAALAAARVNQDWIIV